MIFVGIDPGLTGAIAFICDGSAVVEDIPTIELAGKGLVSRRIDGRALADLLHKNCQIGHQATVVCEAVATMGGQNNALQTQGSLMRSLGAIEAVFDVVRAPCLLVRAQEWQRLYGLVGKKAEKRARGEMPAAILKARALYPGLAPRLQRVKDHNRAEALLIAHYGRETLA